jgi:hypothetical protein
VSTPREDLAQRQEVLLAALVAGGPVPEGFDAERILVQRRSLIAKRRDATARVVPAKLVDVLGDRFGPLFFAYADGRPKPAAGSRADALEFVHWLDAGRHISRRLAREMLPPRPGFLRRLLKKL